VSPSSQLVFDRLLPSPPCGLPAVDNYLEHEFDGIPGMSSRLGVSIMAALLDIQAQNKVGGDVVEIGVFEGRSVLALALALQGDEKAIAIDTFDWPDAGLIARFRGHIQRLGISENRIYPLKADSRTLSDADIRRVFGATPCRLVHIDGDHGSEAIVSDLGLSSALVSDAGLIVIDDMYHPSYPDITVAVQAFLNQAPLWKALCTIDRTSLVAAAKYVLCRDHWFASYDAALRKKFRRYVWPMDTIRNGYTSMILSCDQSYLPHMMGHGVLRRKVSRSLG
jgi:predicted O-methyltransferase YrrM